jgi:Tol biopolymer transport system component
MQLGVGLLLPPVLVFAPIGQGGGTLGAGATGDTLPLVTTRPLGFTTDEGTWMSVDVSADGRTLVFDLLGDLYTLPIGGGIATRITSGQGFDAQPRFSPDGKRIVFVSDRSGSLNLWIADADGGHPRQLTNTEWVAYLSPVWTPDGRAILASRNNRDRNAVPFDFYLYQLEGGTGQRVTDVTPPGAAAAGRFAGNHLGAAFADARHVWYSQGGLTGSILVLDLLTGTSQPEVRGRYGAARPALSPDGKWLVYATRRDAATALRLRDRASGDERWLARDVQRDELSNPLPTLDQMPGMAFTPDSKALITSYGGKLWRIEVPSGHATNIPFTAQIDQRIGPLVRFDYPMNDSSLEVRQIRFARPSPDGKRIAFLALDRVWVADLPRESVGAGGRMRVVNPRRVSRLDASEYSPTWTPDGRFIAFVTWTEDGGDIYRVPADGGEVEKLSSMNAYYEKLAYTPDGSRLLFVRGSRRERTESYNELEGSTVTDDADLMWMPANGGAPVLITRLQYPSRGSPVYYGVPHFGPDSGRVLLYDYGNGLVSMRWDGTDRRTIITATERVIDPNQERPRSPERPVDDIVLSPGGDRAVIRGGQNVFLAAVPPAGPPPSISVARRAEASVPVRRVTRVGGNFLGWNPDGKSFYYSLGASFFLYDLAKADSMEQLSGEAAPARSDSSRGRHPYEPRRIDVQITVPKDRPQGTVALRGARIITMKGDEVIENGDLIVRNNRIAAVGARGSVSIPAGARVIDVAGKTIIPGYVDIHAHMWPNWGLHRMQVWQYLANLAYGVTATRDPQDMWSDVLDYSDRVEVGDLFGPRIYTTARGLFASEEINSLDDARDILRRYSEFFKSETIKQYHVGDRKRRQWIIQAAKEQGLTPTNEGGAAFVEALTFMMDGYPGEEHELTVYPLSNDVVQLAVQSGITYTPTLITGIYGDPDVKDFFVSRHDLHAEPKLQRFWPHSELDDKSNSARWQRDSLYAFKPIAEQAAKIVAAGGRVALGAHGDLQGIGVHIELLGMAMGGMKPHDVLRVGTIFGAEAIGHGRDFGSLEAGKLADLQVLDRNPLEDIRNTNSVQYVMKNGRLYDGNTLDEIWPTQKKLPPQWWMDPDR